MNVGSTFSPTAGQSAQTNAGKAYADRLWDSNSGQAQLWKERFQKDPGAFHNDINQCKATFEGYEQWIEQQAMQIMQQAGDDMGSSNG